MTYIILDWSEKKDYRIGQKILYNNKLYKCLQDHNSELIYKPDKYNTILWTDNPTILNDNNIVYLWHSGNYYYKDTLVIFLNTIYKCKVSHLSSPFKTPKNVQDNIWKELN